MFRKGKIEKNKMQVYLDGFNASEGSYAEKTVKAY